MANSGIYLIDLVYNFCVKLLIDSARFLGITYEEINVWLFVVIWPLLSAILPLKNGVSIWGLNGSKKILAQ